MRKQKQRNLKSLDWKRTLLVTLPFAGALAFWQAYDGIVPLILRDTFHLGDTLSGAIMALDKMHQESIAILLCVFFYFMASNAVTSAFSKYASQVWGAGGGSFANFQLVATMVTLVSVSS